MTAALRIGFACCSLLWVTASALSILPPPAPPPRPLTTAPPPVPGLHYRVSFATTVRPGAPLVVNARVNNVTGPVDLRLSLVDYDGNELQKEESFKLDGAKTFDFHIDKTLKRTWSLWVRARGFAKKVQLFDKFQRVSYREKRLSVFIQTDKQKYQPGQTVKFRAVAMTSDLQIIHQPIDVFIKDPHNNRLAQWLGMESDIGVVQGEMTTSDYPPLGPWKIEATVEDESEEITFELEEYELPQFEVNLDMPGFALEKDPVIKGEVSAKYTFGAPVKGSGTVTAKFVNYRSKTEPYTVSKDFQLNSEGEAEFNFTNKELMDLVLKSPYSRYDPTLAYKRFTFDASVTDDLTNEILTAETRHLMFYTYPMRLRFLTSSPSSFKPGFPLTVQLEVLNPDDTPLDDPEDVTVSFNVTYEESAGDVPIQPISWWPMPPTKRKTLLTKDVRLDQFGVATLTVAKPPEDARSMTVVGKVGKTQTSRYLNKFDSPGNKYLRLKIIRQVGKNDRIEAFSNVKISQLTYQVYSKGNLLENDVKKYASPKHRQVFSVRLTPAMTPMANVIAFFRAADGEVIVDTVAVSVDLADSKVTINFTDSEVKPGENTMLHVKAKPRSTVFLLGVDKSVLLLGKGNDITRDRVLRELSLYNGGSSYFFRGFWWYPSSTQAYQVFQGAGAGIITNDLVLGKDLWDVPKPYQPKNATRVKPVPMPFRMTMERQGEVAMLESAQASGPVAPEDTAEAPSPVESVRTFFPETWLWNSIQMGKESHCELVSLQAPDTITTWVVSAFAVNKNSGLLPAENTAELLVIKRLFIKLDLPYSAVRGEDVCFTAVTFNRHDKPVQATIHLARNPQAFENILIMRSGGKVQEIRESIPISNDLGLATIHLARNPQAFENILIKRFGGKVQEIRESILISNDLGLLKPNSAVASVFCLSPLSLGDMPVHVYLTTDGPGGDSIQRTIRIKPEGVERSESYPVLIELTNSKPVSTTVDLEVPDNIVPGSLRIDVNVVGDVMGGVVDNLGELLKMPSGCGEQNMVNFAPNVYVISYLKETDRLTPEITERSKSVMAKGYQNQLQYQHSDGSFSAFGNRDKSGSMWLTAFVTKCFAQSAALGSDVITVDPAFVSKAAIWMMKYQNADGSFGEPGKVFHRAMQGGSAEGLGLNAFVAIALQEVHDAFASQMSNDTLSLLRQALDKSVKYLESQMTSVGNNSYSACILAYALALTGSGKAKSARQQMEKLAIVGDANAHWAGPTVTKQTYYSWYRKADSLSIEMTSYALLALRRGGSLEDAILVFRWLNKQRGPKGGFISTQDTVLGIEALAAMSELALERNFAPIDVSVNWTPKPKGANPTSSLTIDESNAVLLQKLELPLDGASYPDKIHITAASDTTKRAFVLAEVVMTYNVDSSTSDQVFNADLTVTNNTPRSFKLKACVRRQKTAIMSQSMVLVEIDVPSGYDVIKKASTFGKTLRVEYPEGQVVLYYNSLGSEDDCSEISMRMRSGAVVARSKPAFFRVYDYYNPDDELTTSYNLKEFDICNLAPEYMDCLHAK